VGQNSAVGAVVFRRRISREKEAQDFASELREAQSSSETLQRQAAELRVQLKIVEEARDAFRLNLLDANKQLQEGRYH